MAFRDVEQEVLGFLDNQKSPSEMLHLSSGHMEDVAEEELSSVHGYLSIDHNGRTNKMKSDFIRTIKSEYNNWIGKALRLEEQLRDFKKDLSSSKAQKKIDTLSSQKEEEIKKIKDNNAQGLYGQKYKIKEETEVLYELMRKKNNGKPPRALPIWYFGFLVLIGFGEWLINYETFAEKFAVVAMAIGMTLLVALSFAAASHFHGEALKQRSAQFGKHVELSQRYTHKLFTIIASILFLVCFIAVVMVRYQVIQDQFSMVPGLGGISLPGQTASAQQSTLELLTPTILMNLAVYLLGLVISYAVHDPIPGYQSIKRDAERARKEYEIQKRKLNEEITQKELSFESELNELMATLEQNELEAKKIEYLLERISEARGHLAKSYVNLINDYISQYRHALAIVAKKKGLSDLKIGLKELTIDQYLDLDISVGMEVLDAF